MSEFTNEFPEDLFKELEEGRVNDYEAAFEDPRIRANISALRNAEKVLRNDPDADPDQVISELDREVKHLMGATCQLTGTLTFATADQEIISVESASQAHVVFQGYGIMPDDEDDLPKIGYLFHAFREGDAILTSSAYRRISEASTKGGDPVELSFYYALATPDEARVDFPIASPEQALAWLGVMYPETLEELDDCMLKGLEGDVEDDTQSLRNLGTFTLYRPEDISDEAWLNYRNAVGHYVGHVASIDLVAPYYTSVNGVILGSDEEGEAEQRWCSGEILFQTTQLCLADVENFTKEQESSGEDTNERGMALVFALRGLQLLEDLTEEPEALLVPLSSFTSLESARLARRRTPLH